MDLYLALGANIGHRRETLEQALKMLDGTVGQLVRCSALYETRPVGFKSENLFLNGVALFNTTIANPHKILRLTNSIEKELGRKRKSKRGCYDDRVIDIDLLMLDRMEIDDEKLTLPHPRMMERRFVLEPLCEIAPELSHPVTGMPFADYLRRVNHLDIREVKYPTQTISNAINDLLVQLSPSAELVTRESLKTVLLCRTSRIYLGYDETDFPCAMAVLCLAPTLSGAKAWVEDLVVDKSCRHRGYGRALIEHLRREAKSYDATTLNLTSRPEREAANRLYQLMGFEQRETNVYRLKL